MTAVCSDVGVYRQLMTTGLVNDNRRTVDGDWTMSGDKNRDFHALLGKAATGALSPEREEKPIQQPVQSVFNQNAYCICKSRVRISQPDK